MTTPHWEATDREREDYARLLRMAGGKRRAGLCVHPPCAYRPAPGCLTCDASGCVAFLASAPEDYVRHWQQVVPVAVDPLYQQMAVGTPAIIEYAGAVLTLAAAGAFGGGAVLALFLLGVRVGLLRLWFW